MNSDQINQLKKDIVSSLKERNKTLRRDKSEGFEKEIELNNLQISHLKKDIAIHEGKN